MNKVRLVTFTIFIALFFLTVSASAFANYSTIQIPSNGDSRYEPRINDMGQISWVGYPDGEIYLYDGISIQRLTNDGSGGSPRLNNRGQLAWWGADGIRLHVYFYDGSNIRIVGSQEFTEQSLNVEMNDDGKIVWDEYNEISHEYEINIFDGDVTKTLDASSYFKKDPLINKNGEVVWWRYNGTNGEIISFDGNSMKKISLDDLIAVDGAQVIDNGQIVYWGRYGSVWQLFLYDGVNTIAIPNSGNSSYPGATRINNLSHAVWERNGSIFLYDGDSTTQISGESGQNYAPELNDRDQVVWYSCGSRKDGWGNCLFDISLYDNGSVTTLTESWRNHSPQINELGQVVWQGQADVISNYEIFMASECSKPSLKLSTSTVYWASYGDYLNRWLTVKMTAANGTGSAPAYNFRLTGNSNSNGVSLVDALPLLFEQTSQQNFTKQLRFLIPNGVHSWRSNFSASAQDACSNIYTYP